MYCLLSHTVHIKSGSTWLATVAKSLTIGLLLSMRSHRQISVLTFVLTRQLSEWLSKKRKSGYAIPLFKTHRTDIWNHLPNAARPAKRPTWSYSSTWWTCLWIHFWHLHPDLRILLNIPRTWWPQVLGVSSLLRTSPKRATQFTTRL